MKITRNLQSKIIAYSRQYPVITITGPRQSGKTTLSKMAFPEKKYVSLENLSNREFAQTDPQGFLAQYPNGAVIDEIQRIPDLLSYIQELVDAQDKTGLFILTGSQQFELMQNISQSLAGRTAIVRLLPFAYNEIYKKSDTDLDQVMFTGFFPRIHDKKLNPMEAMSFYVSTYLDRDLRLLFNVKDLSTFETFLRLCAGRTGQIMNLTSLANDSGVSHNTIKNWFSVLETSFLVKFTQPFYKNFNKRIIKAPKFYFLDTALVCYLLGLETAEQLQTHPLRGAIFETFVLTELLKSRYNQGLEDNIYYLRDKTGHEIDFILDKGTSMQCIEVKSAQTIRSGFIQHLQYFANISDIPAQPYIVYGGDTDRKQSGHQFLSWRHLSKISAKID